MIGREILVAPSAETSRTFFVGQGSLARTTIPRRERTTSGGRIRATTTLLPSTSKPIEAGSSSLSAKPRGGSSEKSSKALNFPPPRTSAMTESLLPCSERASLPSGPVKARHFPAFSPAPQKANQKSLYFSGKLQSCESAHRRPRR